MIIPLQNKKNLILIICFCSPIVYLPKLMFKGMSEKTKKQISGLDMLQSG